MPERDPTRARVFATPRLYTPADFDLSDRLMDGDVVIAPSSERQWAYAILRHPAVDFVEFDLATVASVEPYRWTITVKVDRTSDVAGEALKDVERLIERFRPRGVVIVVRDFRAVVP